MYCVWRVIALWADEWNSRFEVFPYFINLFKYVFNTVTLFHGLRVKFLINYAQIFLRFQRIAKPFPERQLQAMFTLIINNAEIRQCLL